LNKGKDTFKPTGDWLSTLLREENDYEQRKVARTERKDNNGIGVSTCWVDDFKCYGTALVDANNTYVVERYRTKKEATKGHKKWVKFARNGDKKTVVSLGDNDFIKDEEVVLEATKGDILEIFLKLKKET